MRNTCECTRANERPPHTRAAAERPPTRPRSVCVLCSRAPMDAVRRVGSCRQAWGASASAQRRIPALHAQYAIL